MLNIFIHLSRAVGSDSAAITSPRLPLPSANNLLVLRIILALTSSPRLQSLNRQLIFPLEDQHVAGLHVHQRAVRVRGVQVPAVAIRFQPCDQLDDFALVGFELKLEGEDFATGVDGVDFCHSQQLREGVNGGQEWAIAVVNCTFCFVWVD